MANECNYMIELLLPSEDGYERMKTEKLHEVIDSYDDEATSVLNRLDEEKFYAITQKIGRRLYDQEVVDAVAKDIIEEYKEKMTNERINQIITKQIVDALFDAAMEWTGDDMNRFNATSEELMSINDRTIHWKWSSQEQDDWSVTVSCPVLGVYDVKMKVSLGIEVRGLEE